MCVLLCACVYLYVWTPPGVLGLCLFLPFSSFLPVSVIIFSLRLFLHVVTPLRCVAPEGLVSHRGSGGFSPSLSPEDASTSCSPGGQQGPEAWRPSPRQESSYPLGRRRSCAPKLAHKSGRQCSGWGDPPAAWSPGTKAFDWSLGVHLRCGGLVGQGHRRVDWKQRWTLRVQLPMWYLARFGWSRAPWRDTGRLRYLS